MICIEYLLTIRIFTAVQMPAHLVGAAPRYIVYDPVVTGRHALGEAVYVSRSVEAQDIRHLDHDASKIGHQLIDGFYGRVHCIFCQMCVNTGRSRTAMAQPGLDES